MAPGPEKYGLYGLGRRSRSVVMAISERLLQDVLPLVRQWFDELQRRIIRQAQLADDWDTDDDSWGLRWRGVRRHHRR